MYLRLIFVLFVLLFTASPASAEIDYLGNIELPAGTRNDILHQATSALDTASPSYDPSVSDQILYLVTTKQIYYYTFDGSAYNLFPLDIPFQSDVNLVSQTNALLFNRQSSAPFDGEGTFVFSGGRNSLIYYNVENRVRVNSNVEVSPNPKTSLAYGHNLTLVGNGSQIWSVANTNEYGSVTDNAASFLVGSTGTGAGQFNSFTEMAFAPGANGLLYVLDWGNQRVEAFDVDDASNPFRLSFQLPSGLENNTTGLGFAIDDFGHVLIADGNGGGIELDLLGNVIGTFDPPAGDTLGVNTSPGDSSYITYNSAGDIFVEDGANGMHWYRDSAAVPEPSTNALFLVSLLSGALFLRHRKNAARPEWR